MADANVEGEPIRQASFPGVTAHAADASGIAGGKLLDALHIAPPLRPTQGMVDGLADFLDRCLDTPDGDKAVVHLICLTMELHITENSVPNLSLRRRLIFCQLWIEQGIWQLSID